MHPIERLRYVARTSGVPQALLVREAGGALMAFTGDPHALVTACRRMIARQPTSGPLVWLASRMLTASDPADELRSSLDLLDADTTALELRHALPADTSALVLGWPDAASRALPARGDVEVLVVDVLGEGSGLVQQLWNDDFDAQDVTLDGLGAAAATADLILLESSAIGPDAFVAVAGTHAAAAIGHHRGIPVWLVGGVGRLLPGALWESMRNRIAVDKPWQADEEVVPLDLVTHIVGPSGSVPVAEALQRVDCPVAAELLRPSI